MREKRRLTVLRSDGRLLWGERPRGEPGRIVGWYGAQRASFRGRPRKVSLRLKPRDIELSLRECLRSGLCAIHSVTRVFGSLLLFRWCRKRQCAQRPTWKYACQLPRALRTVRATTERPSMDAKAAGYVSNAKQGDGNCSRRVGTRDKASTSQRYVRGVRHFFEVNTLRAGMARSG